MMCGTALLNPNAFPAASQPAATAAARRFAIFLFHCEALRREIEIAKEEFFRHLTRNWKSDYRPAVQGEQHEFIAYSDGIRYLSALHAALYEMKAFLDLFMRLMCPLISSKPLPDGFRKGNVGDESLSGGRLINWIYGHRIDVLPSRDQLIAVIEAASKDWITPAVHVRDTVGHYRELPGFRHMRVSVSRGPRNLSERDILVPEMPDGYALPAYAFKLREHVGAFVSAVMPLLPNVNRVVLEDWGAARRYLHRT